MKKLLNIILCALVAVSIFTVSVSAVGPVPLGGASETASFNEDYTSLTYKGEEYSLIDGNDIGYDDAYDDEDAAISINLTEEQLKTVAELDLMPMTNGLVVEAEYRLNTGVEMSITYLNNKYMDRFQSALTREIDEVGVDFMYPEKNYLETTLTKLKETKKSIKINYSDVESFAVQIELDEKLKNNVYVVIGEIVLVDDAYYYLDYMESGMNNSEGLYEYFEAGARECTVYQISDPDTLWSLENCYNLYNEDMGVINDEEAAEAIVNVLATIVFAVLPLVVLVLSVIFAIRFKEKYRKLFITLGTVAIAEIIVFAIISVLLK